MSESYFGLSLTKQQARIVERALRSASGYNHESQTDQLNVDPSEISLLFLKMRKRVKLAHILSLIVAGLIALALGLMLRYKISGVLGNAIPLIAGLPLVLVQLYFLAMFNKLQPITLFALNHPSPLLISYLVETLDMKQSVVFPKRLEVLCKLLKDKNVQLGEVDRRRILNAGRELRLLQRAKMKLTPLHETFLKIVDDVSK